MAGLDVYYQDISSGDPRQAGFPQPHQVAWAASQGHGAWARMTTGKISFDLERIFFRIYNFFYKIF
jgi:hypothetical protein